MDDTGHYQSHQFADHAVALQILEHRTGPVVCLGQDLPQGDVIQHLWSDHPRLQTAIQVMGRICQLIGHIADLCLLLLCNSGLNSRASVR